MPKSTDKPLDFLAYNKLTDQFHKESDRAAAILAGAYLDSLIELALRLGFYSNTRDDSLFGGQGALQSFAAKISIACALGLITEDLARDMDYIRKIRNHFAHHILDASFESSPVVDWCAEISIVDSAVDRKINQRVKDTNSPRNRYLLAIGMCILQITHSDKVSEEFRAKVFSI